MRLEDCPTQSLRRLVNTSVRLLDVLEDYDLHALKIEMLKDRAIKEIQRRQ